MKTILITGARSGIAYQVIQTLKRKDYQIYVSVHTSKELEQVKKIYHGDSNVICIKLDITNPNDWQQLDSLSIDIYFANAAIGKGGSLLNMDIDKVRENYETNVFSNLELIQHIFQKTKRGKIIMMSSLAGIIPIPFLGSYCSSKASLKKWMECLRLEIKLSNIPIQVSIIEPGLYQTGFNQVMLENKYPEILKDDFFSQTIQKIQSLDWILLHLEQKNFSSLVSKICKAVESKQPKFIYRMLGVQTILAKFYQLFFT